MISRPNPSVKRDCGIGVISSISRRCAAAIYLQRSRTQGVHHIRTLCLTTILAIISASSFAAPLFCGGATGELTFEKSPRHKGDVESVISVTRGGRSTILRYDGGIDFIGMQCQTTKSGKPLLVFQAYCGGSACHDLDNYGIIDPSDLRVLLIPSDTNRKLAKQILGTDPAQIQETESISVISERLFSK